MTTTTTTQQEQKTNGADYGLQPQLGLYAAISIVVGAVIGSGIFAKPAIMAEKLGSPELMIAVWVAAGIITMFGALTNAEIVAMMPDTGGQYVYFRAMYGDFFAYIYGWSMFIVVQSASIAAITYIFSQSADYFFHLPVLSEPYNSWYVSIPFLGKIFPLQQFGIKILTVSAIFLLSYLNFLGAKIGGGIQSALTTLKVGAMALIVMMAFTLGDGDAANFTLNTVEAPKIGLLAGIVGALSAAFWAYDGWNNITYIGGEIRRPQRTIPLSFIIGISIVVAVYVIFNLAIMYILPVTKMIGVPLVAVDAANGIFSSIDPSWATFGFGFVAAAIMLSTIGTSNGTIMVTARLYFAMARKGFFFRKMGNLHAVHRTPDISLWIQAVWSSVLVFSGTFDTLTDMLIFITWLFYAMGSFGLFVLRKKMPNVERTYKVWGYPFVPAVFLIFASSFVLLTLYTEIDAYSNGDAPLINSVFGLALVSLGIPYYYWKQKKSKA